MSFSALIIAAPLGLLAFLLAGLRWVPEGCAYTVRRFGRYARTLPPGLGFVLPLIERVGQRVRLIGHTVPVGQASVRGAVYYQIIDPRQTGEALESIDQYVQRTASETLSRLPLPQTDAPGLDQQVRQQLNEALASRGLRVVRCVLPASA
ncbi:SPFH domain-containing protein [Aquimonas voraii]|uniref:SPFH domain / Band 7 family protein n=1 Tax=Aquimonas voraii TaxID=265719 RepID=A0A1G6WQ17_9GAMM|nr:SPFH domain-containing protein [Aquimonas voraii]SDD67972.1 SPFH domain / Band 7 family protein [Aquimonas voraii]